MLARSSRALGLTSLTSLAMLAMLATLRAAPASAQRAVVRIDSVLLTRDLDGDDRTDYIVRESRRGDIGSLRAVRLALYLGAAPGTGRAAWATQWNDEIGDAVTLVDTLRVDRGALLLHVSAVEADYEEIWLALAEGGRGRTLIHHGIDYGEGLFVAKRDIGRVVVYASQSHLELPGRPRARTLACPTGSFALVKLLYEPTARRFAPGPPRCVRPEVTDSVAK